MIIMGYGLQAFCPAFGPPLSSQDDPVTAYVLPSTLLYRYKKHEILISVNVDNATSGKSIMEDINKMIAL